MRRKRTLVLTGIVLLVVALSVQAKPENAGPAEKATGSISIFEPYDDGHREVSFNAHEAKGNRPAKGQMKDLVYDPDGNLRRTFEYDVEYVNVDGDTAYFGAQCTYDSAGTQTGEWLYVKVHDGGTPGRKGDHIGWKWGTETEVSDWVAGGTEAPGWWRAATDGNLVVHTK